MSRTYIKKEEESTSIDLVKANADQNIFRARKDLINILKFSKFYDPREVLALIPDYFLHKEKALILAK